jgi:hypothetical protein
MRAGDTQTRSEPGHRSASERAKIAREPFVPTMDRLRKQMRHARDFAALDRIWIQVRRAVQRNPHEAERHARRLNSLRDLFDTKAFELDRIAQIAEECAQLAEMRRDRTDD